MKKLTIDLSGTYDVKSHECLMVGNDPKDKGAAEAAGVAFMWAKEFFGRAE